MSTFICPEDPCVMCEGACRVCEILAPDGLCPHDSVERHSGVEQLRPEPATDKRPTRPTRPLVKGERCEIDFAATEAEAAASFLELIAKSIREKKRIVFFIPDDE